MEDGPDFDEVYGDDNDDEQQMMMWDDDDEQFVPDNVAPPQMNMKVMKFGLNKDFDKASNNSFEFSDEGTKKDYMKLKFASKDSAAVIFESQKQSSQGDKRSTINSKKSKLGGALADHVASAGNNVESRGQTMMVSKGAA